MAQLILWRETSAVSKKGEREYLFRVGVTGSSGPATYALSSLFVDEENKLCDFLEQKTDIVSKENQTLLYDLQGEIRYAVVIQYLKKLDANIDDIYKRNGEEKEVGQRTCYRALVKYTLVKYLSTVLYRYFFPFLTQKDIRRIYNGLYMFVHSMKAEKVSPFALKYSAIKNSNFKTAIQTKIVEEIIDTIPLTFEQVLKEFEGVEVFYKVKVQHSPSKSIDREAHNGEIRDMRKVKSIEAYNEDGSEKHKINYWGF